MSVDGWNTLLVLGGIRSGKSEFAETLVRQTARVRYLATAASRTDDPEWSARIERHRRRRPQDWATEEIDADPSRLAQVIAAARPDETLLVDDLGGWVSILLDPAHQPADDSATITELAAAIRDCAARLVLVSPEVGLAMVPLTPLGRAFTDALGVTNQTVAAACDAVVLVVAGQPSWLKSGLAAGGRATVPAQTTGPEAHPETGTPPPAASGAVDAEPASVDAEPVSMAAEPVFKVGMDLPMPDDGAGWSAMERLNTLEFPGAGLGRLDRVVQFAAATQGNPAPQPWQSVRVLLIHGDHEGGAAAGVAAGESARRVAEARAGRGPLATLAARVGATLEAVSAPSAAPMEEGPALTDDAVETALRNGWQLVARAAADGVQVLVLAACGAGAETAAAAVLAATAGAEPAAVLGRVIRAGGRIDDASWMTRCAAVRDALHRTRHSQRDAKGVLAELGGADLAVATGVLLSAAAHRLPVLVDGPVGIAAGLVSRDLGGQARHWCLLPDHGGHPGVRFGADMLDLDPLLDLRLDLGEGVTALSALPLLRSALVLAATAAAAPSQEGTGPGPTPADSEEGGQEPTGHDQEPTGHDQEPGHDGREPLGDAQAPGQDGREPVGDAQEPGDGLGHGRESSAGGRDDRREAAGDDEEFVEPEPAGPGPARAAGPGA